MRHVGIAPSTVQSEFRRPVRGWVGGASHLATAGNLPSIDSAQPIDPRDHRFSLATIPGACPSERNHGDLLTSVQLPPAPGRLGESGVCLVHGFRAERREALSSEMGAIGPLAEQGCPHPDRHHIPGRTRPANPSSRPVESVREGVDEHPHRWPISPLTVLVPHRTRQRPKLSPRIPRLPSGGQPTAAFRIGDSSDGRRRTALRFRFVATQYGSDPQERPVTTCAFFPKTAEALGAPGGRAAGVGANHSAPRAGCDTPCTPTTEEG